MQFQDSCKKKKSTEERKERHKDIKRMNSQFMEKELKIDNLCGDLMKDRQILIWKNRGPEARLIQKYYT